ncbi:MAG TPA: ABC transporter ATP-binding protein [Bauldia sp.]|nr:ABC transporter ATP-binding protein [Bauldia sp.]
MSFLRLDNVFKTFGEVVAVDHVSLEAERGEFVVFVGPSGCGKSTLLRMIAGLEEVSGGRIEIDGRDMTDVAPAERQVSMVFQSYALFPHMTVRDNIGFGLKMSRMPRSEIEPRVLEAARILQIEELLDRKPRQLSGGQRQRVAIGRAIIRKPKLFLFDEPLSNLDADLRTQMRVEIARLHEKLGVTMVYVTHDQTEAMTLADRIVVMRAGRVEQIGSPVDLYEAPANSFVAGFIGSPKMNFVPVTVTAAEDRSLTLDHPALPSGHVTLATRRPHAIKTGEMITLGIRPEHLTLDGPRAVSLNVAAELVENLGGTSQIYVRTERGESLAIVAPGRQHIAKGERLSVGVEPAHAYLFDREGRAI